MNGDSAPTVIQRSPIWVIWTFAAVALGGWIWSQTSVGGVAERNQEARHLIRTAQIEACERNNSLREAHNHQNAVLREIMTTAAAAAETTDGRASMIEFAARLNDVELTDCEEAYPEGIETAGVSDGG